MKHAEQWIWLPATAYQKEQTTVYSGFDQREEHHYTVAEFQKTYTFPKKIRRAALRFSGDTVFQLFCNDRLVATGPACVGGDFLGNETVRENFYAFEETVEPDTAELRFFARVQLSPCHICDFSKGHGGFMLSALLVFEDGTEAALCTDESWQVRKNGAYHRPKSFDGRITPDGYVPAEITPNIWNTLTAPIPAREETVFRAENSRILLAPHEEKTVVLELDRKSVV